MKDSHLVDFHRGWLIEVEAKDQAFRAVCYSPCRKRLTIQTHDSDLDAFSAAKQAIDYQIATHMLAKTLREFYETEILSLEEWATLQHSLQQSLNPSS